ncbi:hypothetical protein TWF730_009319 [Orbilia blumenaviensis]|uniref:Uncharacterized protein n=1 Tax=Orbilia blumenaviensis TaxID=1796055 RepID=A0AAV9V0A1_9PEZI
MKGSKSSLDLTAHPHPPSSPHPISSLNLLPSLLLEEHQKPSPLSPIPIKPLLDPILASDSLESQVFAQAPGCSLNSSEDLLQKRAREFTINSDSIPSSAGMDGSSTAATSPPPPSGAEEAIKPSGTTSPALPPPDQQIPVEAAPVKPQPEPELAPTASTSNQRPLNTIPSNSLNEPKAQHIEYFLNSLPADSSSLSIGQMATRPRSPGRVPAAVHALEEAHKRNSQGSERGPVQKIQDRLRQNVRSQPKAVEKPAQKADAPQPESSRPQTASSIPPPSPPPPPVVSSNGVGEAPDNKPVEVVSKKTSGFRFLMNKVRSNTIGSTSKQVAAIGIERQESSSTTATSSTPLSAISANRYAEPLPPPVVGGVDKRNDATFYRDLRRDFENRRLQGKHEHPVEGSTALHNPPGIKGMGWRQLFRSVSRSLKRGSHGFKKLVLRRAITIPNQLSVSLLGQPLRREPESNKALTRAQRWKEYEKITREPLPTFGPRVPTPPPRPPLSRCPSAEGLNNGAPGPSSDRPATTSPPLSTPPYRQIGLFASQPQDIAAKLTGRGKPVNPLANGDSRPINPPNGENYSSNSQLSSSSGPSGAEGALSGGKSVPTKKPAANNGVVSQAPPAGRKRGGSGGAFLKDTFNGW